MLELISNHLHASLIATGKLTLLFSQADITSLLEDVIYQQTLKANEREISIKLKAEGRPTARVDIARIQDIFSQLLEGIMLNVFPESEVRISIRKIQGSVKIEFSVDGQSNKVQQLKNAALTQNGFASRHMISTSIQRTFESNMPIIRQVIEHHGGMLWISNGNHSGHMAYIVELPIK